MNTHDKICMEILYDHFYDMSKNDLVQMILDGMSKKELDEWMESIDEMIHNPNQK